MKDAYLSLSLAQDFTGAGDEVSTDKIDLKAAGNDFSVGRILFLMAIHITTAAKLSAGDETYEFRVLNDDDAALGSPTVIASRAIDKALLTVGSVHYVAIPPGSVSLRYLGAQGLLGGTTPTVSATMYIIPADHAQVDKYYADNSTIS